ncbi:hypothetical protein BDN67DRAFT_645440 [Paxillus ammoniavirescens]|nr:hypothetical protein BDN67DRAFT_645440 [Paxillus ammoniavirescens]
MFTGAEALMIAFPFGGGGCLSLYANYGVDYPPDSTDYCGQFAALGIISIIIGGLLLFLQIAIVNYSRRLRLMALREPTVIHCHYINPPPASTPLGVPVSAPPYGPLAGGFSPQLLHQQQGTRTPLDSSHAYPPSSPYGPLPPQPNFRAVPSAKEGGHVVQLPSQPDFNQTYPRGGDMELLARA